MLPTTCHVYFGSVTGATPDGRKAGLPLSEGISPVQGADRKGPTAVLQSAAKMDHIKTGGTLLNMKFTPVPARGRRGHRAGSPHLVRSYFKLDGHHVQFNVVDADTLREAQADPEAHRDLIVRVAGYSDYFCDLSASCRTRSSPGPSMRGLRKAGGSTNDFLSQRPDRGPVLWGVRGLCEENREPKVRGTFGWDGVQMSAQTRAVALVVGILMTMGCAEAPQRDEPVDAVAMAETRSIELTVVAEAAPEEVFALWSTVEGTSKFFAPAAQIGSAVGEPYVIVFNPEGDPEGAHHGTKGAVVRSLELGHSISFGWTFPPFGPDFNTKPFPTWVEIVVEPFVDDPSRSLVHFAHRGFPVARGMGRGLPHLRRRQLAAGAQPVPGLLPGRHCRRSGASRVASTSIAFC